MANKRRLHSAAYSALVILKEEVGGVRFNFEDIMETIFVDVASVSTFYWRQRIESA